MTGFNDLLAGYKRFRTDGWAHQRERWESLVASQSPKIMVIACSDSRVDPATIFDASPGEMFVVRNVANLVPPFELGGGRHGVSAALEFAVTQLEVHEIIVLGHGNCGGVGAALSKRFAGCAPGEGGFIDHWIDLLDGARERVLREHGISEAVATQPTAAMHPGVVRSLEHEAVKVSIANLRTFPCIPEREADGRVRLRGSFFAIDDGILSLLDEPSGTFHPAG
jgi:carbonic anhydrase